jgi:hypothetical protein
METDCKGLFLNSEIYPQRAQKTLNWGISQFIAQTIPVFVPLVENGLEIVSRLVYRRILFLS